MNYFKLQLLPEWVFKALSLKIKSSLVKPNLQELSVNISCLIVNTYLYLH